jgi:uncharacterized SAM-binding protein YcdF (DUF218 family)
MLLLLHLKTVLRELVLPPAGLLLLGIAGLLLLRRRPRLGRILITLALGCLWLISMPLISNAIVRFAQAYPPLDLSRLGGAQAIVILGGGVSRVVSPEYGGGPAAGPGLMDRLAYGAYLSRRSGLPILITGFGYETDAMQSTLRTNFDIQPRWIDRDAYDTFQNARNAAALLRSDGIERVVVITRATHMRRSVRELAATGLIVLPAPMDIVAEKPLGIGDFVPSTWALLESYEAIYELIGEPVGEFLAATNARRQQPSGGGSEPR